MTKKQLGIIVRVTLAAATLFSTQLALATDMAGVATHAGHALQRIKDVLDPETSGMMVMGLVLMGTIIHRRIKSKAV